MPGARDSRTGTPAFQTTSSASRTTRSSSHWAPFVGDPLPSMSGCYSKTVAPSCPREGSPVGSLNRFSRHPPHYTPDVVSEGDWRATAQRLSTAALPAGIASYITVGIAAPQVEEDCARGVVGRGRIELPTPGFSVSCRLSVSYRLYKIPTTYAGFPF